MIGAALANAADRAYASVREPAEGTILTVAREMARQIASDVAHSAEGTRLAPATEAKTQDLAIAQTLEQAVAAGQESVKRGPEMLPALREAGVVDAGGYGLTVLFAGVVAALRGEEPPELDHYEPARIHHPEHHSSTYRFCTNFAVTGHELAPASFIAALEGLGDSVLVVGDSRTLKVHVHTDEPERATAVFAGVGEVSHLDVADMRLQVAERSQRLDSGSVSSQASPRVPSAVASARCGAIAVVSGAGLAQMFAELGVRTIDGGPTLNPSTYELLAAIHDVEAEEVVVLPNSTNVIMAAERAAELSDKQVVVVRATSQQAGLAAAVALAPERSVEENAWALQRALEHLRSGAVAPAARADTLGRFQPGDAVGFVEEEMIAWGEPAETLRRVLESLARGSDGANGNGSSPAELISVLAGAERARSPRGRASPRRPGARRARTARGWPVLLLVAARGGVGFDGGVGIDRARDHHVGMSGAVAIPVVDANPSTFAGIEPLTRAEMLSAPLRWPHPARLCEPLRAPTPKAARGLDALGLHTVGDLLEHLPRESREACTVAELRVGEQATVAVEVRSITARAVRRRGMRPLVEAWVADSTGGMRAVFFNQPWLVEKYPPGTRLVLHGKAGERGSFGVTNHALGADVGAAESASAVGVAGEATTSAGSATVGHYPATEGINSTQLLTLVRDARHALGDVIEPLPAALRHREGLPDRAAALGALHFPRPRRRCRAGTQPPGVRRAAAHPARLPTPPRAAACPARRARAGGAPYAERALAGEGAALHPNRGPARGDRGDLRGFGWHLPHAAPADGGGWQRQDRRGAVGDVARHRARPAGRADGTHGNPRRAALRHHSAAAGRGEVGANPAS